MREKCKKLIEWDYFPFVCLAICMLFFHLAIQVGNGDDANVPVILSHTSILGCLKSSYMIWQARSISTIFYLVFGSIPYIVWRLTDTVIIVVMAWALSILFEDKGPNKKILNWFIAGSLLIYPWLHMSTAGWIATTTNYSWVVAASLIAMIPIRKKWKDRPLKAWEYPLYVVAGIMAGNQEQGSAMLLFIYLVATIYLVVTRKKKCIFLWIQTALSVASLVYIFACPGNKIRAVSEQKSWFPDFSMLSPLQKADQGISRALCQIFFTPNVTVLIVCILAVILVFRKYNDAFYRAISLFPLAVLVIMGFLTPLTQKNFPGIAAMSQQASSSLGTPVANHGLINFDNFTYVHGYLAFFVLSIAFVCILVSIFLIFAGKEKGFILCIVLIGSLAVTAVLGFSPTIWASTFRTFIFQYFAFIICGIAFCKELLFGVTKMKKYYQMGYAIIVVLCFLNTLMLA